MRMGNGNILNNPHQMNNIYKNYAIRVQLRFFGHCIKGNANIHMRGKTSESETVE